MAKFLYTGQAKISKIEIENVQLFMGASISSLFAEITQKNN